ncbi:MAG: hypothetical protein HC844_02975 [Tabrizicola sp.]|nr:hypothetical protein [Tabrizicola sp.]
MCNACGYPAAPGPWTEAGAATPGDRLRTRFHRVAVLNRILRPYGLSADDGGWVPGLQLGRLTGERVLVGDLGALWQEAERFLGHPIDPLDPRYLDD